MASLVEIEDAIRKASAKGDKELVKKLGVHYNRMKAGNKDSSLGTALENSFERMQKGSLNYTADLAEKVEDSWFGKAYNQVSDAVNENVFNPIRRVVGIDEVDANTAETGNIGTTTFVNEARRKADAADARANALNYETMTTKDVKNIPTALQFGVQKAAESLPYMTTGPLMLGAFIMPGEVNESLKEIEGLSTEKRLALASSGGAIMGVLERIGAVSVFKGIDPRVVGKLGVKGVIKKLQERGLTKIANAFARGAAVEGITEVGQENVQIAAENIAGKDFKDGEWFDRSKEAFWGGFAAGGTISGGGRTVTETGKGIGTVFKTGKDGIKSVIGTNDLNVDDKKAAASFAQRLDTIAQNNGYDLQDVDKMSTNGAYTALEGAHVDLVGKLNTFFARVKKAGLVDSKKAETLEEIEKAILAEVTQKQARNKTKGRVKRENFDALKDLVDDTGDGQILLNTIRELDILTQVHNNGYQGKLSSLTDTFAIFGSRVGYDRGVAITEKVLRPAGSLLAAKATGGTSLIPQLVAPSVGRAIDKYRGTYSSIDRFINQNKNNETLPARDKPLISEVQAAEAAEADAAQAELDAAIEENNLRLGRENAPPTPGSPEHTVQLATGLDKQGIATILRVLKGSKSSNKVLMKQIADYEKSIAKGGKIENEQISPFIRELNNFINQYPRYENLRVRPPDNGFNAPDVQTEIGGGFQAGGVTTNTSSGYNRGIQDNKMFVGDLQQRANKDTSLSLQDKGQILTALDTMSRNLGSDPMTTSQQIHDKLLANDVNTQAVGMYVKPYVDRIANQQNTAPQMEQPVNQTMEAPNIDTETFESKDPVIPEYQPKSLVQTVLEDTSSGFTAFRNPPESPGNRSLLEIGDVLEQKQKQIHGRTLDFVNDEGDFNLVVEGSLEEFDFEVNQNPGALEWYDDDVKQTIETLSEVIPELRQDDVNPDATIRNRAMLTLLTALTSVGQKPKLNIKYGAALAKHYFETGEVGLDGEVFSEKRGVTEPRIVHPVTGKLLGQKAGSIEPNLHLMRQMISDMGFEGFIAYIHDIKTVKELNDLRAKTFNPATGKNMGKASHLKGGMTAEYPAVYIFGPKVGPFFNNMNGIEDATVDLWATRHVHQHAGGLKNPLYKGKDDTKNSQLTDSPTSVNRTSMKDVFKAVAERRGLRSSQQAQAVLWSASQNLYRDLGGTAKNEYFSEGAKEYVEQDVNSRQRQDAEGPIRDGNVEGGILKSQSPTIPGSRLPGAALTTPSSNLSLQEVKPHLQPAKEVFEIGKKGSEFENGVDTMEKAQRLANALNVTIELVDKLPGGSSGTYANYRNVGGAIKALRKGSDHPAYSGEIITEIDELTTVSHEIAHALGRPRIDREVTPEGEIGFRNNPLVNQQSKAANLSVHRGSFEDFILDATGLNNEEQIAIIKEIINLQENVDVVFENRPELGKSGIRAFRKTREVSLKKAEDQALKEIESQLRNVDMTLTPSQKSGIIREFVNTEKSRMNKAVDKALKSHRMTYTRDVNELAVDPLMLYISNPKMAKELAPTVSKKIRYLFNNFGGPKNPVTFYTFPLATILAIVMASLAAQDAEDEERNRLMQAPPGALTPPPAALSGLMI